MWRAVASWNASLRQNREEAKAAHTQKHLSLVIQTSGNTYQQIYMQQCRTLPNLGVDEPDEAGLDEERYADLDPSRESEVAGIAGWYHPTAASSSGSQLPSQFRCPNVQIPGGAFHFMHY